MACDEAWIDLSVGSEAPVVEHPDFVSAVGEALGVVDHEHAVEPALDLLGAAYVGMKPEGARVLRDEAIRELSSRRHRVLSDPRHAVHGVGDAHPVPVDGRRLGQIVPQPDDHLLPQPYPEDRSRDLPVVRPDVQEAPVDLLRGSGGRAELELAGAGRRRSVAGVGRRELPLEALTDGVRGLRGGVGRLRSRGRGRPASGVCPAATMRERRQEEEGERENPTRSGAGIGVSHRHRRGARASRRTGPRRGASVAERHTRSRRPSRCHRG